MRQVVLVCGPPGAGKAAYVAKRRQPGDVVLDQDAIGSSGFKRGLIKVALMTSGRAWVIRCCPGQLARGQLAQQVRATEVVLLAPPLSVLLHQAAGTRDARRAMARARDWWQRERANRPPLPPTPPTQSESTTKRGYGAAHQAMRQRMLPGAYGLPCHLCGQVMLPGQPLDLDHTEDRRGYRGMTHASCNRSDGAKRRAARTAQRIRITTSQRW